MRPVGDPNPREIRDEGLAFFGKIIAGQSHEVTNVLNIINELAGLLQDVLRRADQGQPVNRDKLQTISEKIQTQVQRGQSIVRTMNQFGHSSEARWVLFPVKEALARIVFLAERSTRLNQVELVSELSHEDIVLENNPFFLQQAVFSCIDMGIVAAREKRRITVGYRLVEGGVEVVVACADPIQQSPEIDGRIATLRALLDELSGELREIPFDREARRFVFYVSNRRNAAHAEPQLRQRR